jgi:hypothetical protein
LGFMGYAGWAKAGSIPGGAFFGVRLRMVLNFGDFPAVNRAGSPLIHRKN